MKNFFSSIPSRWIHELTVASVIFLGLFLRLYHLGSSSLWFDEAGVAMAAAGRSLADALNIARSHVMAMPMDYVTAWGMARICASDACLRLPAALWGTLSVGLLYLLARRLAGPTAALLAALILALSPLHLYYSQELRFYAALVFFTLLVTLLLWDALAHPTPGRWALAAGAAAVGCYFHIYVLLAFANGLFWLVMGDDKAGQQKARWVGLFWSAAAAGLLALPGLLIFHPRQTYAGDLSPVMVIYGLLAGLGWLPHYTGQLGAGMLWFGLFATLQGMGLLLLFRKTGKGIRASHTRPLRAWTWSTLLQIGLIVLLDIAWNYWINPRQFLPFLPWACVLAGFSISELASRITKGQRPTQPPEVRVVRLNDALALLLAGVLVAASLPALAEYYPPRKSLGREISTALAAAWQPGQPVLLLEPEYPLLYQYYLERMDHPEIAAQCSSIPRIGALRAGTGSWVVAGPGLSEQERQALRRLGYAPAAIPGGVEGLQTLWRAP
jgi:4-amino-4-deoxy-L-arabinose transferase-like glycosyltransferase